MRQLELKVPHKRSQDRSELQIRELLADATMSSCSEWLVRALRSLANSTVSVVDSLAVTLLVLLSAGSSPRLFAPSLRLPCLGICPHGGVDLADGGRSENEMALGDDEDALGLACWGGEGGWDGDGLADLAHDGVDRGVDTEGLADDRVQNRELAHLLVSHVAETAVGGGEVLDLLVINGLGDVGVAGDMEKDPGASGRGSVLAGHEEGDHDVGDFVLLEGTTVFVALLNEGGHGVFFVLCMSLESGSKRKRNVTHDFTSCNTLPEDVNVELGHLLVGSVPLPVTGQREVGEQEVERREASVEIIVQASERLVERRSNLLALEGPGGGENGDFLHDIDNVERAPFALGLGGGEAWLGGDEVLNLLFDHADVRAELVDGEGDLDKLLLLHENVVGNVVDDVRSEDRGGEVLRKASRENQVEGR